MGVLASTGGGAKKRLEESESQEKLKNKKPSEKDDPIPMSEKRDKGTTKKRKADSYHPLAFDLYPAQR